MFGKKEDPTLTQLKKNQTELNEQLTIINNQVRALRKEMEQVETAKKEVGSNRAKIDQNLKEIASLQKNIQGELTKFSRQIASTNTSEESEAHLLPPEAPPPLPPASKIPKPFSQKTTFPPVKNPVKDNPGPPKPKPNDLIAASNRLRTKETIQAKEQTPEQIQQEKEEDIRRFKNSNENKKTEINRLLGVIRRLSSALETEIASHGEYQQAVQSQTELLGKLSNKKIALEEKFKNVSKQVSAELSKIEIKMEEEKVAKEQSTTIVSEPPPFSENAPPPPPPFSENAPIPPPPPPVIRSKVQAITNEQSVSSTEKKQGSSAGSEKPTFNVGAIQRAILEKEQRREAQAIKAHLISKLIDIVVKEATTRTTNKIKYLPDEHELKDLLGNEEYQNLKTNMIDSVISNESKDIYAGLAGKNGLPKELAMIPYLTKSSTIKEAIGQFIDGSPKKNDLLDFSKEARKQEVIKKQKEEAEEELMRAKEKEEKERKDAEKQKIKAQEETQKMQKALAEMGIKEGMADPAGIAQAKLIKNQVLEGVIATKPVIESVEVFLDNIDKELNKQIIALQKAEELRIEALNKAEVELNLNSVYKLEIKPKDSLIQSEAVDSPSIKTKEIEHEKIESKEPESKEPESEKPESEKPESEKPESEEPESEEPESEGIQHAAALEKKSEPKVVARFEQDQKKDRRQLIKDSKFDEGLFYIKTLAANRLTGPEAIKIHGVCNQLINAREQFINNGNEKKFYEACEKAEKICIEVQQPYCDKEIKPSETKNIAAKIKVLGWIQKKIQSIYKFIGGKKDVKVELSEKFNLIKNGLEQIKCPTSSADKNEDKVGPKSG